jgi:hypothetical protein
MLRGAGACRPDQETSRAPARFSVPPPRPRRRAITLRADFPAGAPVAKPNYSFEKRQREIAKKKAQAEKDARKQAARDAAKDKAAPTPGSSTTG